jgi:hypothetical protein
MSRDMKQFNVVAAACIGGIGVAMAFAMDLYPFIALAGWLAAMAYLAFAPDYTKKPPPAEPWYMK